MAQTASPLLELPDEILIQIIENIVPESLPEAAGACKSLHAACYPFFEGYRRKSRRFKHFKYDGGRPSDDDQWRPISSCVDLLEAIAEDPSLGRYIKHASFLHDSLPVDKVGWFYGNAEENEAMETKEASAYFVPAKSSHALALRRLFHASPYLRDAGFDPDACMTNTMSGLDINVFLLTLLPNAERLAMPSGFGGWGYGLIGSPPQAFGEPLPLGSPRSQWQGTSWREQRGIWRLFDLIVRRANERGAQDKGASLAGLQVLDPHFGARPQDHTELQYILPLLTINSLREFRACRMYAHVKYFGTGYQHPASGTLDSIELVECCLWAAEVQYLLKKAPKLKSFRLAQVNSFVAVGNVSLDFGATMHAISLEVADTLEELRAIYLRARLRSTVPTMDMKRMKRLKTLEIDVRFLIGPAFDLRAAWWDERCRERYGDVPDATIDSCMLPETRASCRLVDILPPSIERLKLVFPCFRWFQEKEADINDFRKLFEATPEERMEKLPNLRDMLLVVGSPGIESPENLKIVRDAGAVVMAMSDDKDAFDETFRRRFGGEAQPAE